MRIMPYRTTDNRIDGAVLTFASIGDQKKTQDVLDQSMKEVTVAKELVRNIFDMNSNPMAVLDKESKLVIANTAFTELLNLSEQKIKGVKIPDVQNNILKPFKLRTQLNAALKNAEDFKTPAYEIETSEGKQKYSIRGQIIKQDKDLPYRILLQFSKAR